MKLIEELAKELAERDVERDLDPVQSIEEMKTVLARLLLGAYEKIYVQVHVTEKKRLPYTAETEDPPEATEGFSTALSATVGPGKEATRVVSEERRAELVEWLRLRAQDHNWRGYRTMFEEIRRALLGLAGPTKRELDLDELLHSSYMDTLLMFAEETGADAAPVAAQEVREWRRRI